MTTIIDRFRVRRGTAADLATVNEVPLDSEIILESDTRLFKIGDGSTHYNDLSYSELPPYFAIASGTDTIIATFATAPVLLDGITQVSVRAAGANTGATTFNPNSMGALAVKKLGGLALDAGDIHGAGHELVLRYIDGSPGHWEFVNIGSTATIGGSGKLLQSVFTETANTFSTTNTTPAFDNTIPQITEGDEVTDLNTSITPLSALSTLLVQLTLPFVSGNPTNIGARVCIFRDSGANAIFATSVVPGGNSPQYFIVKVLSGSLAPTTFTVRIGVSSGTAYLNRTSAAAAAFGGVMKSLLSVTEIFP